MELPPPELPPPELPPPEEGKTKRKRKGTGGVGLQKRKQGDENMNKNKTPKTPKQLLEIDIANTKENLKRAASTADFHTYETKVPGNGSRSLVSRAWGS